MVSTNDPNQAKVNLNMSGKVNKFAEITPRFARLAGEAGEKIELDIIIVPEPEYRFKIKKVSAKNKEFINFELKELNDENPKKYLLHIENTKANAGRYADSIQLHTDSKIQPVLTVGVYGYIKAKDAPDTLREKISGSQGAN